MEPINITIGFSPCPNDTYMFAALVNGWIDTEGIRFSPVLEDVETLNQWAARGFLDVTKMSFHRSIELENKYHLLSSGAALGNGCGPLVIAKEMLSEEKLREGPVALPGEWTTAHLLFKIFFPESKNKQFHVFSSIEKAVLDGSAVAGVIIHENRFTYEDKCLVKILDLGEAWEMLTGLPIPLGGIFASDRLSVDMANKISRLIRQSILYAHSHPDQVMPYVREHAQEMDDEVMNSHIQLYVNDFSLALGEKGLESIATLKKMLPKP